VGFLELSVLDCYGKSIITSDDKKLGIFLNLIMNRNTSEATLAVFPGLKSEWALKKAGRAASTISGFGTRVLQHIIPELYDVADVVSEVQYEVIGEVSERADRKATHISGTYYCIPAINVEESNEDSLILDLDTEECKAWYRNIAPSSEAEFAFFDESYYKGPYRAFPISLNLQPLRGMLVNDPAGLSARITDVKFDTSTGNVSSFEVKYRGQKKFLDTEFITLEYGNCVSTVGFQDGLPAAVPLTEARKVYLDSTRTEIKRMIISAMDRPKTGAELAKELGYPNTSAVSRQLIALEKDGAATCLTPERRRNRQFYLTELGLKARRILLGEEQFET